MLAVQCKCSGDFDKFRKKLEKRSVFTGRTILEKYGERGVRALSAATPKDTGQTADSWYYQIKEKGDGVIVLEFCNDNRNNGVPIALILQYGHVTGTGGWVEGQDYINPALRPIFDDILNKIAKEVAVIE